MTLAELKKRINSLIDEYERERDLTAKTVTTYQRAQTGMIGSRQFPAIACELYELLKARGPLTEKEQCQALGYVHMTVRKYREQLVAARLVRLAATVHTGTEGRPALHWQAL